MIGNGPGIETQMILSRIVSCGSVKTALIKEAMLTLNRQLF